MRKYVSQYFERIHLLAYFHLTVHFYQECKPHLANKYTSVSF